MVFKTSLDKTAIIITSLVTLLFAVIIIGQFSIIKDEGKAIPIYTTVACLLIYFIAFAFRPIKYIVTNDELIVKRLLLSVHIKRGDINSVALIDEHSIKGSIRTFGVGGMFGYFGNFANFTIGKMTWYATRRDSVVLVKTTNNKNIILTPDMPNEFLARLSNF